MSGRVAPCRDLEEGPCTTANASSSATTGSQEEQQLLSYEQIPPFITLMTKLGFKKYAAVSNTFLMMERAIGTKEARDRCKSTWTTMGVVSALLASVSLAPIFGSIALAGVDGSVDIWDDNLLRSLLYSSVIAFICNIVVILMSVMFYVYVDHCFGKDSVGRFIHDWIVPIMALPIIFSFSCGLIVIIVLLCVAYTTDMNKHFTILASVVASLGAYLIYLASAMAFYVGRECANEYLKDEAPKLKGSE